MQYLNLLRILGMKGLTVLTILNFQRWNFIRHMLITPRSCIIQKKYVNAVRWQ